MPPLGNFRVEIADRVSRQPPLLNHRQRVPLELSVASVLGQLPTIDARAPVAQQVRAASGDRELVHPVGRGTESPGYVINVA